MQMSELQAKSNNNLALCPFCGGEADVIDYDDECWVAHQCANGTSVETNSYDTEAEAIAAWNSRAERTCECIAEYAKSPIDGKTIVLHRCSSCHELMRPHMSYCPNCGCKVVGE